MKSKNCRRETEAEKQEHDRRGVSLAGSFDGGDLKAVGGTDKDDHDAEDLEHQPSITAHAGVVLEQFALCALYVPAYPKAVREKVFISVPMQRRDRRARNRKTNVEMSCTSASIRWTVSPCWATM